MSFLKDLSCRTGSLRAGRAFARLFKASLGPPVGRHGDLWRPASAVLFFFFFSGGIAAHATLPEWLQHVVGASSVEAALYRAMQLPSVVALYPRPPKEAQTELAKLERGAPDDAELYQLRARADEQALDETAAEADWKAYAAKAKDPIPAKLQLADFYERRLMVPQEIAVLNEVAAAPSPASEEYVDPTQQRAWRAYERILGAISMQGLPAAETGATFDKFIARYPDQPALYAADLQFRLDRKDFKAAEAILPRYRTRFPKDEVFPVRARALIDFRRGNIDDALAVYDRAFQPLWPAELVQSYLDLLGQTHRQRAFVAEARERLAAHPDGPEALNAVARVFYCDRQAGRLEAAERTLDAFRAEREARKGAWTPEDLSTLAALTEGIRSYSEAARYNFALASLDGRARLPDGEAAAQYGLAGLIHILLEAPDQPLAIGSQNLTLYRDIATLDQGPGYWNGILSLWLNGENPRAEYDAENAKSQGYFHRAKAAELLAEFDKRFPAASERAALHAEFLHALTLYGEPGNIVAAAKEFLADFPAASERLDVGGLLADAYASLNDTEAEFALYDAELAELSAKTHGLPLTAAGNAPADEADNVNFRVQVRTPESVDADAGAARKLQSQPLAAMPSSKFLPAAAAYGQVLDRYIGRLVATRNLPRALTVLRGQLDRNPNDPLLYERLATFLQQNNLSAQEEEVYRAALARFEKPTYYDKLARFYLRRRQGQAFADLTRKVTDIFSGTELDAYFQHVGPAKPVGPQLALELNLYAAKRFPHDMVFTRNLLRAYQVRPTRDSAAYEALLRRCWWQSPELRDEFLDFLASNGKLAGELDALRSTGGTSTDGSDPAAQMEMAQIEIFTSQFEQAAPSMANVAGLYPADAEIGDQAVSLFRSLAYLDPTPASTERAVALETNLLKAEPDSPERLATLGDLYAEATAAGGEDLAAAEPYWRRIPELHPGSTEGFLTSSTIFWDYFQFDDALGEVTAARRRFDSPSLFGYEAGAIEENRRDMAAAVAEYTKAVVEPIAVPRHFDAGFGAIAAWLAPPSDAGDSRFRATVQSFFGSEEAHARLMQLATRTASRAAVYAATGKAVEDDPANTAALTLRADVLAAQHHAPELAPLLTALFNRALDRTATLDEAGAVGSMAQARNLTAVYERALAKQAALTLDPVQKIQLEYSLAQSLEGRKDVAGAAKIIDAVYAANPRILGVVRATADFYGRTDRPRQAVATLLGAAKVAAPGLARDFTMEAASRANDAGETGEARTLGMELLAATPYDARVLDIVATSYARVGDDAGLKAFYLGRLEAAKKAAGLAAVERKQDIALLRRGLIPALDRLQDFAGGLDQYIALISAFPEDTGTAQEAALYALKHSIQPQLLTFLRATVKQAPQDSRFAILLAQAETTFEDLPGAEAAYGLAIAIRKDRVDLYAARADLEVRLSQSDAAQSDLAAADFARLYVLSYHDPEWMVRIAELRARQGRAPEAIAALRAAYIDGHPKSAADSFAVAKQLADWNLVSEARLFADQGVALAGNNFLAAVDSPDCDSDGPAIYARIMTRLGHADQAIAALLAAREAAEVSSNSPALLAAEIARQKLKDDEERQFRANMARQIRQTADRSLGNAIDAVAQTVKTYYTPEQKLAFARTLDQLHADKPYLALQAAETAGLADRETDWRRQILLNGGAAAQGQVNPYEQLEQRRLDFKNEARTLESYALLLKPGQRDGVKEQAAKAYRSAGDLVDETRLDRALVLAEDNGLRDRYFDLLLKHDRAALIALADSRSTTLADAAVNYAVAKATEREALAAVARRSQAGQGLPPVWGPASASLVETYFASPKSAPAVATDFTQSLGSNQTVADRLANPADPQKQLTGDNFFYYASRFGVFLATMPVSETNPPAEDFLAADLERAPTAAGPYLDLARTYAEAGNVAAATGEYRHALELVPAIPGGPAIQDELSVALYRAGKKDEAIDEWHDALATLRHMQQKAIYPEAWFTSLEAIAGHLGERHLTTAFTPDLETILGPYLARNGTYRSNELLKAVFLASATPEQGTSLILTLAASASEPTNVLADLNNSPWLPEAASLAFLERRYELVQKAASSSSGGDDYWLGYTRRELMNAYIVRKMDAKARALLDSLPPSVQKETGYAEIPEIRIVLAAHAGSLDALLAGYRASPSEAPGDGVLSGAADRLEAQETPDHAGARALREIVFDRKQLEHALAPTDFLALAQSRLDTGDMAGALTLLRRLSLQPSNAAVPLSGRVSQFDMPPPRMSGEDAGDLGALGSTVEQNPYANTDSAAALLERARHPAEAIEFLEILVQSVPWNESYRFRLAEAERGASMPDKAAENLVAVAKDASAPYGLRVRAARSLAMLHAGTLPDLGSRELTLIARPETPEAAAQPYFVEARLAAAQVSGTAVATKETLWRDLIGIAPESSAATQARLALLLAQPASAEPSATLAILNSLNNSFQPPPESETPEPGWDSSNAGYARLHPVETTGASLLQGAYKLDPPAQIRLAGQISLAYERDGDLVSALRYAQLAVDLAQKAPQPAFIRRRDALQTALELEGRNAPRRPDLHKELAQSVLVRPRLTPADLAKEAAQ